MKVSGCCLLCIDGMMPAGIDPVYGPVYRDCPYCHPPCLECDGRALFPAIGGYPLELLIDALDALGFQSDVCRYCFGITSMWPTQTATPTAPHLSNALGITISPPSTSDNERSEDDADTIHRVENVLRELADNYYAIRKKYEEIAAFGDATDALRAFYCAEFATLAEIGNQLADALGIAAPNWEAMGDLAKTDLWADFPEPGVNP
jgi:hypothetical protein